MITLGLTYEIHTPESIEYGDAEERGWERERETWEPGMLREFLKDMERCEVASSGASIDSGTWWTAYRVNDGTREYYETGAEKSLSFHIDGATLSTMRRIDKLLKKGYW